MDSIYDLIDDIADKAEAIVREMELTNATAVGLDQRAAYRVWVNRECIAIRGSDDRTMQYYGGFEYVDKDYRHQLGDYVFYMADDDRVQRHIEEFYERDQEHAE